MKSSFPNFVCLHLPSKKPMATHQASINIQEPTKFKLEVTRTRVEYRFQLKPNSTNSRIRAQFKNQALQIRAKNSPSSRDPNQNPQQPNLKSIDLNHGGFCSSDNKLWWCGNPRPEGNIRPKPLIFFSLSNFWNWNSETWHRTHISEFLNFRCQTSFCRIPPIQNLSVLAHEPMKTP